MDHCHLTGEYRGAAHSKCTINFKLPSFIPVYFNNLAGYDVHLFIKDPANTDDPIEVIPNNKEIYISLLN